ncbi:MAG: HlyD family type I secretion periplasmic adaptor subunit [Litoreibacter sp.]|nr:HlyD family type I secretion periplasmic adaptor subunit [Litoreibacter sp.]
MKRRAKSSKSLSTLAPLAAGFLSIFLVLSGTLAWGLAIEISGAIVTPGIVEVSGDLQIVQHPDGGVVSAVAVHEGELVMQGDILIRLDPGTLSSKLQISEARLFEAMAAISRLEAERDNRSDIAFAPLLLNEATRSPWVETLIEDQVQLLHVRSEARKQLAAQLLRRKSQITDQISGIRAQLQATRAQSSLLEAELDNQQQLQQKGLSSSGRILALEREKARLQGLEGELTAAAAQSTGRLVEIDQQALLLKSQRMEETLSKLRDLRQSVFELTEKRESLKLKLTRLKVPAPVSGRVFGLKAFVQNSVVAPADPLMFIVPQDRALVVGSKVKPSDVDEIFPGQDVALRFPAFKSDPMVEIEGTVATISADVLTDATDGRQYYKVEIELEHAHLYGVEPPKLIPGMPAEVYIQTGKRTAISYLTKPLTEYFRKSLRES